MSMHIQQCLNKLGEARSALDPYTQLPNEYTGELRRHALAQTVHYSTQIEGNTLTLEQVESLLAGEIVKAPQEQVREALNYRESMNYVQTLIMDHNHVITEDVIRTIHYMISNSLPGNYAAGRYRTEQNYVVDRATTRRLFLPPPPEDVNDLMREFVEWVNSETAYPFPIKAALAHLNFVAIHPFLDGNGRAARVLDSLIMYSAGFKSQELVSLEAYFGRDNQGYYQALAASLGPHFAPPMDATTWVEYYLNAHVEQAHITVREVRAMVAEMDGLHYAFGPEGVPISQIIALWIACRTGHISNRAHRSITGRSAPSAAADFTKLLDKDLLIRIGAGRSTAYIPSRRTREAFDAVRDAVLGEPDDS